MSQATLSPELTRAARTAACEFFDGHISSADAAQRFAHIARSGWHGECLNALHAEFDAAVARLIDGTPADDAERTTRRQFIGNCSGPEGARTMPFDTGTVHGPEPLWRVGQPMPAIVADRRMEGQLAAERAWREATR